MQAIKTARKRQVKFRVLHKKIGYRSPSSKWTFRGGGKRRVQAGSAGSERSGGRVRVRKLPSGVTVFSESRNEPGGKSSELGRGRKWIGPRIRRRSAEEVGRRSGGPAALSTCSSPGKGSKHRGFRRSCGLCAEGRNPRKRARTGSERENQSASVAPSLLRRDDRFAECGMGKARLWAERVQGRARVYIYSRTDPCRPRWGVPRVAGRGEARECEEMR